MSDLERTQLHMHRCRAAFLLLMCAGASIAGCSSGSDTSNGIMPVPLGSSPNPGVSSPSALILRADPGPVCETLVAGEAYTRPPPALSCNGGADPFTAYLDGSKSTSSNGGQLGYTWAFASKPDASAAQLVGADTAKPTFTPDIAGVYTVQLIVSNSGVSSPRAIALVVALDDATLNPNFAIDPNAAPYNLHGGLASNCVQCHTAAPGSALQGKPSTHVATSDVCQTCHSPKGFNVVDFVDHDEVFGYCSSCHDGVTAIGKSQNHLVTTQECSDCHTTTSFVLLAADGTFDHTNITGGCSACHNGTVARGTDAVPNPPGHPSIAAECNACHTTQTFATPFPDHSDNAVVAPGTCGQSGCHDGASVLPNGDPITSKNSAPFPHPSTGNITVACDLCHDRNTFDLGNAFDHTVLARHPIACKSCHDGNNAMGVVQGHLTVTAAADCGDCHHTSTFVGGFVDHQSAIVTSQACTACHDGTTAPGTPTQPPVLVDFHAAAAAQTCDTCHTAGGSFALALIDHSGFGTVGNTTLPPEYTSCAQCHQGGVATGKPIDHLETAEDCGACHDPQRDDWFGAAYDHSAVAIVGNNATPTCESCHNGQAAVGQSLTHVPHPLPDQDCLVCHGTTFVDFTMPTFDHFVAGITDNCASCHDGKPHDSVVVITKPRNHIPAAAFDCSACHADTTNGPGINGTVLSGFTNAALFVNVVHPAFTTGCGSCHNGSYDNATYGATGHPNDSVHATVLANNWECNACHSVTGGFLETNPVNHKDPAILNQQCVSCHADGRTSSPLGKPAFHPATSDTCQHCHQAGGSFVGGFDHTTLNPGGINNGLACSSCHNGQTAVGKTSSHLPTTRDCQSCHAGYPPTASSFANGTFDHVGPEMQATQCMDCHNGGIALGKPQGHVATNADCGACHSTDTFVGATGFDHTGVVNGCAASGCHTSGNPTVTDVTDDPNPLPHIPIANGGTEVDCYHCHKSAGGTFAAAVMDHSVVTFEACESCHDGNHDGANTAHIVTPKSANHFITAIDSCASCHTSTTVWTSITYRHVTNGGYPGDHSTRRITRCAQCHNNTPSNANISTFPSATYGSTCAACHASEGARRHGSPLPSRYYNCATSGCHRVSSTEW